MWGTPHFVNLSYKCNSPVATSDFDRLISDAASLRPPYWGTPTAVYEATTGRLQQHMNEFLVTYNAPGTCLPSRAYG